MHLVVCLCTCMFGIQYVAGCDFFLHGDRMRVCFCIWCLAYFRAVCVLPLGSSRWLCRAEMSGLAFGTEPYLGTSSCWRQPSLAPIIPQVFQSLSPSGDMCLMTDVFECLFRCNFLVFALWWNCATTYVLVIVNNLWWNLCVCCAMWRAVCPWMLPRRDKMGTVASTGMTLNWTPVSVWLSFTLLTLCYSIYVFLSTSPFQYFFYYLLLCLHFFHFTQTLPSLCLSFCLSVSIRQTHPSLLICRNSRGIDWWSQPPSHIYYSLKH